MLHGGGSNRGDGYESTGDIVVGIDNEYRDGMHLLET